MSKYLVDQSQLTALADAIRQKGGTSSGLTFPTGMIDAIDDISTGEDIPLAKQRFTEIKDTKYSLASQVNRYAGGKFVAFLVGSIYSGNFYLYDYLNKQELKSASVNDYRVPCGVTYSLDGDVLLSTTGTSSGLTDSRAYKWYYNAGTQQWIYDDTSDRSGYGMQLSVSYRGKDFGIVRGYNRNYNKGTLLIRTQAEPTYVSCSAFGTKMEILRDGYKYVYFADNNRSESSGYLTRVCVIKVNPDGSYNSHSLVGNGYSYDTLWWFNNTGYAINWCYMNRPRFDVYDLITGQQLYHDSSTPAGSAQAVLAYDDGFLWAVTTKVKFVDLNGTPVVTDYSPSGWGSVAMYKAGNDAFIVSSDGVYFADRTAKTVTKIQGISSGNFSNMRIAQLDDDKYYIYYGSSGGTCYVYQLGVGLITDNLNINGITSSFTPVSTSNRLAQLRQGVYYYPLNSSYTLFYIPQAATPWFILYTNTSNYNWSTDFDPNYTIVFYKENNSSSYYFKIGAFDSTGIAHSFTTSWTSMAGFTIGSGYSPFSYQGVKYFALNLQYSHIFSFDSISGFNDVATFSFSSTFQLRVPDSLGLSYHLQGARYLFSTMVRRPSAARTVYSQGGPSVACIWFDTTDSSWHEFTDCSAIFLQTYDTSKVVYRSNTSPYNIKIYDMNAGTSVDIGYAASNTYTFGADSLGNVYIRNNTQFIKYDISTGTATVLFTHSNHSNDGSYSRLYMVGDYMFAGGYYASYMTVSGSVSKVSGCSIGYYGIGWLYFTDSIIYLPVSQSSSTYPHIGNRYFVVNFTSGTCSLNTGAVITAGTSDLILIARPYSNNYQYILIDQYRWDGTNLNLGWTKSIGTTSLAAFSGSNGEFYIALLYSNTRTTYFDAYTGLQLRSTPNANSSNTSYRFWAAIYNNMAFVYDCIDRNGQLIFRDPDVDAIGITPTNLSSLSGLISAGQYPMLTTKGVLICDFRPEDQMI